MRAFATVQAPVGMSFSSTSAGTAEVARSEQEASLEQVWAGRLHYDMRFYAYYHFLLHASSHLHCDNQLKNPCLFEVPPRDRAT